MEGFPILQILLVLFFILLPALQKKKRQGEKKTKEDDFEAMNIENIFSENEKSEKTSKKEHAENQHTENTLKKDKQFFSTKDTVPQNPGTVPETKTPPVTKTPKRKKRSVTLKLPLKKELKKAILYSEIIKPKYF